jgi:hypothetical protein
MEIRIGDSEGLSAGAMNAGTAGDPQFSFILCRTVNEILHGVTFTGLGLLDRQGADENARILQVASMEDTSDDETYSDIAEILLELNETPSEELSDKIDAVASVLPDADVSGEDRLETDKAPARPSSTPVFSSTPLPKRSWLTRLLWTFCAARSTKTERIWSTSGLSWNMGPRSSTQVVW